MEQAIGTLQRQGGVCRGSLDAERSTLWLHRVVPGRASQGFQVSDLLRSSASQVLSSICFLGS